MVELWFYAVFQIFTKINSFIIWDIHLAHVFSSHIDTITAH